MSQFRVSPPRVFPAATRSSRPPAEAGGSSDAHRQTGFILGADVDLVLEGLEIEGDVARRARTSKYRNQVVASVMATWSRAWLVRLEALHALEWGNYVAAAPLVQASAGLLTSAHSLLGTGATDWTRWLDAGGIAPAHDEHATEIRYEAPRGLPGVAADNGPFATVAAQAVLLAGAAHAATVLLSAPESTPARVAAVFGDRDFNLAPAELILGWLISLSRDWLDALAAGEALPAPDPDRLSRWHSAAARELTRRDRCRIESSEFEGVPRNVILNWRRTPSGAPRRILL